MAATITSKGYKKPNSGDRTWWDDTNYNTQRLNDHSHDGNDSAVLSSASISKATVALPSGSWLATSGGTYRQLATHPTGITFPGAAMSFYLTSTGHQIYPTVEKASASTYYVYINDNTLDVSVVYA